MTTFTIHHSNIQHQEKKIKLGFKLPDGEYSLYRIFRLEQEDNIKKARRRLASWSHLKLDWENHPIGPMEKGATVYIKASRMRRETEKLSVNFRIHLYNKNKVKTIQALKEWKESVNDLRDFMMFDQEIMPETNLLSMIEDDKLNLKSMKHSLIVAMKCDLHLKKYWK